jgi:hypothetical protein
VRGMQGVVSVQTLEASADLIDFPLFFYVSESLRYSDARK